MYPRTSVECDDGERSEVQVSRLRSALKRVPGLALAYRTLLASWQRARHTKEIAPRLRRAVRLARSRSTYFRDPTTGPPRLLLEPTTSCNHRCIMCPDHSPRLARPIRSAHMPLARIEALLREVAGMGTRDIWLAGRGEPVLHPEITKVIGLIAALGLRSFITTNGSRLTEDLANRLCEAGLWEISVSINAGRDATYGEVHGVRSEERRRILDQVRRMSQRTSGRPRVLVSIMLLRKNCAELVEWAEEAIAAGADCLVIGTPQETRFDMSDLVVTEEEEWKQVRQDLNAVGELAHAAGVGMVTSGVPTAAPGGCSVWPYASMACFIGHELSVVDVRGGVRGCCNCANDLGSVADVPFARVWRGEPYRRFRRLCREMPEGGPRPLLCDCDACGHLAENAALQAKLELRFRPRPGDSGFAHRAYLAEAICRELDDVMPVGGEGDGFRDMREGDLGAGARTAVLRLQGLGVVQGRTAPGQSGRFYDPHLLATRSDGEIALRRALEVAGLGPPSAERAVNEAAPRHVREQDPLLRAEVDRWVRRARSACLRPRVSASGPRGQVGGRTRDGER